MSIGNSGRRDIVVIGASAGGVPALQRLVKLLPADFPAAVFVVLHIWPNSPSSLPEILARAGNLPAVQAEHGDVIVPGRIYVAPPDHHLMVEADRLFVTQGPRENRFRPAINPLFRSAALAFRHRVIGIVLTGMLDDGAAGLWAIARCGGVCVVQADPQFEEMPRRAAERVNVDYLVPLDEIAPLLVRLTQEPVEAPKDVAVPDLLQLSDDKSKMKTIELDMDRVGKRSIFTCPECNGALWEITAGGGLEYACHVGHVYTPAGLDSAQNVTIEQSLWSAARALKENAAMHERLADRAAAHGLADAAQLYRRTASERLAEAASVQTMLSHRPTATTD